jgi:cation diffusion facilitator family transporter
MPETDSRTTGHTHSHHHHDHPHDHDHSHEHDHSHSHEQRTRWVIYLTAATMVLEIGYGYWTNSMALLAEGYHMSSHVFALGLTWIAYVASRKYAKSELYSFNKKKLLALTGFSSAIVLQVVAILMGIESFERLMNPMEIKFNEAIIVSVIGLAVNALSAFFLHHEHEHHDHNIRSAYLHVLADGLTSVLAILALGLGMYFNIYSLDSFSGIISSLVITKWAIDLIRASGKDLIDYKRVK